MRKHVMFLSALAVVGLLAAQAHAITISVDFSSSGAGGGLLTTDTAGVVPATNWNNAIAATAAGTGTVSGSIANLNNSAGAATGVGVTFSGSSLTNNPRKVTGFGTAGDQKMMKWSLDTYNDNNAQQWFDTPSTVNNYQELLVTNFGPQDAKMSFTNLNAAFPNGYKVYVYVKGTSPGFNAETGAGYTQANARNAANPIIVVAGAGGSNAAVANLNQGTNSGPPATQTSPNSVEVNANLTATSSQRAELWPTTVIGADNRIADFQGYVDGSAGIGGTDNLPLDFGPLTGQIPSSAPPPAGADYPLNTVYAGLNFQDPTVRGITIGNYVLFNNFNFNTLDIDGRNIAGMRVLGAGSTSQIEAGGISGIQIVGIEATNPVPEPSTFALAGLGLAGLGMLVWRKRKAA